MKILLIADIHGNFPALNAVMDFFATTAFTAICNCGDCLVYGPFPNETLHWLEENRVYSIIGNTDRKVKKLLKGKGFKKPRKDEKRIMYTWTADQLNSRSAEYLCSLKKSQRLHFAGHDICLFHGSPEDPDEFLFPDTSRERFNELSISCGCPIIVTGHSHTPFHTLTNDTHFINPGSVGRMFDGDPSASCAVLELTDETVKVTHYRVGYPVEQTIGAMKRHGLPDIYHSMYRLGKKLN
ncbi:MAG: metallophosphoesterase family protein [Thermodesulfobacteriota bacterium]